MTGVANPGMNRVKVKRALVEQVRQAAAGDGVAVFYGFPSEMAAEMVWFGDMEGDLSHMRQEEGRRSKEDRFTIAFEVWIQADGLDAEEAEVRGYEVAGIVVDLLAERPNLGGPSLRRGRLISAVARTVSSKVGPAEDGEGYAARVIGSIACHTTLP